MVRASHSQSSSDRTGGVSSFWKSARQILALAALVLVTACGGGGGGGHTVPNAAPLITTQPASQTINAGSVASFTVVASGNPTPSFTWQRSNDGGTTWAPITGATGATYSFTVAKTDHQARFRATAANTVSPDAVSNAGILNVQWLAIATQPADQNVTAGSGATLSISPDANPAATFQWQSSPDGTTWTNVPGATSASYDIPATSASDSGTRYRCVLSNATGSINSRAAMLTVFAAPAISSLMAATSPLTAGNGTTLTAAFSGGTGTLDHGLGAVTSGVAVSTGNLAATTTFTLTVINAAGTSVTQTVTVTVVAAPTIASFTAAKSPITTGTGTTLTGLFSGGIGTVSNGIGAVTPGVAAATGNLTADSTYTLTVTNAAGTSVTQNVTVTVVAMPAITSFTAAKSPITTGSGTTLTGSFSGGTGSISNGIGVVTTGVAASTGSLAADTTYTLTVTNAAGTSVAQTVTVAVVAAPTIASFTAAKSPITTGTGTTLTGLFSGGLGTVSNGIGAVTPGVAAATGNLAADTTYTLTVTNAAGTSVTQNVTVTVVAMPAITSFTAAKSPITTGSGTTLTGSFSGGTGSVSQGIGVVTTGVAASTGSLAADTTYTLTVTNAAGTSVTQAVTVAVVAAPAITSFAANPAIITAGDASILSYVFTGGLGSIDQGVTSPVASGGTSNVSPAATTSYRLTVSNAAGDSVHQDLLVTVVAAPTITASSFTNTGPILSGATATLQATFANGNGVVTPGNLSMTSGVGLITGSLAANTTFTLTVTNAAGTSVTATTTVIVGANLTVNLTGLGSLPGHATITGPSGYLQTLTSSQTLTGLADGVYTISASTVTDGTKPGLGRGNGGTLGSANLQRYPAIPLQTATLASSGVNVATITVDYPPETLSLTVNGIPFELVLVPAGTFTMGETETTIGSYPVALSPHSVTIARAFYVAKVPCTQAQWLAIMGSNPSNFSAPDYAEDLGRPVEKVSFDDITAPSTGFLDLLNAAALTRPAGSGFRLPSEAEFEHACRAGSTTNYYFGAFNPGAGASDVATIATYIWSSSNSAGMTHPVGQLRPNAWGLYDMAGLVWQLCQDDWHASYDVTGIGIPARPDDGTAWVDIPGGAERTYRGGEFDAASEFCQSKFRQPYLQTYRDVNAGFRLVLQLP